MALSTLLPSTTEIIQTGIADGLHIGAQLYVSIDGKAIAEAAMGEASPGTPMTCETLMRWMSCTKPVVAIALAQLWERGLLDIDDRVATHISEFAAHGKERVTLRHLLTHTGGFPNVDLTDTCLTWPEIVARICQAPLERGWVPGRKAGYHQASSWYILGEIVKRLAAMPVEDYVRRHIFSPLGMTDSWLAMTPAQRAAYGNRIGVLYNTTGGKREPFARETESAEIWGRCNPGGSGRGPIRDLGRFYEMLLFRGELNGNRIVTAQTIEACTARHRVGMRDSTFGHVVDFGLGFIIDSNPYGADTVPYGYGRRCSTRTFGHGGFESSSAFCDPEHNLVVAWVMNGTPGFVLHNKRCRLINTAIYDDLGLS